LNEKSLTRRFFDYFPTAKNLGKGELLFYPLPPAKTPLVIIDGCFVCGCDRAIENTRDAPVFVRRHSAADQSQENVTKGGRNICVSRTIFRCRNL